jgi:hypothetical protein
MAHIGFTAMRRWFLLSSSSHDGGIHIFIVELPLSIRMGGRMATDEAIGNGAMRNSLFLNNLEQWIDDIISQDGLADKELIKTIKDRFQRSMQANIEHHRFMMTSANGNDDQKRVDRHKLMADVYQALLNV